MVPQIRVPSPLSSPVFPVTRCHSNEKETTNTWNEKDGSRLPVAKKEKKKKKRKKKGNGRKARVM